MDLSENEKLAPSAKLAELLAHYADRIGGPSTLDDQEVSCVSRAVSLTGFSTQQALEEVRRAYDALPNDAALMGVRHSLDTVRRWLQTSLEEAKDATFLLDGYHAAYVQRQQEAMAVDEELEEQVSADLDICGYAGKWKKAQAYITNQKPDLARPDYWQAVRNHFLELGGCYLSERTPPAASHAGSAALSRAAKTPLRLAPCTTPPPPTPRPSPAAYVAPPHYSLACCYSQSGWWLSRRNG